MAKKRKEVKLIVLDTKSIQKELDKPLCFNEKRSYCRAQLCGQDWYDSCSSK